MIIRYYTHASKLLVKDSTPITSIRAGCADKDKAPDFDLKMKLVVESDEQMKKIFKIAQNIFDHPDINYLKLIFSGEDTDYFLYLGKALFEIDNSIFHYIYPDIIVESGLIDYISVFQHPATVTLPKDFPYSS